MLQVIKINIIRLKTHALITYGQISLDNSFPLKWKNHLKCACVTTKSNVCKSFITALHVYNSILFFKRLCVRNFQSCNKKSKWTGAFFFWTHRTSLYYHSNWKVWAGRIVCYTHLRWIAHCIVYSEEAKSFSARSVCVFNILLQHCCTNTMWTKSNWAMNWWITIDAVLQFLLVSASFTDASQNLILNVLILY